MNPNFTVARMRRLARSITLVALAFAAAPALAAAQATAPVAPPAASAPVDPLAVPESETARVVRLTALLEQYPNSPEAGEQRRWLFQWVDKTHDVTVTICDILGPLLSDKPPRGYDVFMQMLFGNAAYQLTAGRNTDELSRQFAGVQSALRAYTAMQRADSTQRIPYMDELLAAERQGKLRELMAPRIAAACKRES